MVPRFYETTRAHVDVLIKPVLSNCARADVRYARPIGESHELLHAVGRKYCLATPAFYYKDRCAGSNR